MKDSDWLAGFTDGEGCFLILATVSHRRKLPPTAYRFIFTITLRDDDIPILYCLQGHFGGKVRIKNTPSHIRNGSHPTAVWEVASREDIIGIITYFDTHLLHSKKRRDYKIWREATLLYYRNSTQGGQGHRNPQWLIEAMESYRTRLKQVRKYNSDGQDAFVPDERGRQPSLPEI